ncbi:MAG: hypothetical protein ACR2PW_05605, partial [Gammaproteobacteria bacterium]
MSLLTVWMLLGVFNPTEHTSSINTVAAPELQSVQVLSSTAIDFSKPIRIRASTEAERKVIVTSRITAIVTDTPVRAGQKVASDTLLCQLAEENRRASLNEAEG